jgi:hypothetical protein
MNYFENTPLKPTSIKLFNSKISEWIEFMPKYHNNIISIVLFPDMAMKALNTHIKTNTNSNKHIHIMAILSFLRHNIDCFHCIPPQERETLRQTWININNENEAPIIERRLQNKPTDLQLKKGGVHLTFNDLCLARDELSSGSIERLLFSMYTIIPPVRADYFSTQIIYDDEVPTEKNFIRIRGDTMESTLTDFKTARQYKQIVNQFPPELVQEVKASLEKFPRNYLFVNTKGVPYTRTTFTIWARRLLTKLLETDFTLVFFRHAFVTHFFATHDLNVITDAQIKEVSDKMGHSPQMFLGYKWIKSGKKGDFTVEGGEEDD